MVTKYDNIPINDLIEQTAIELKSVEGIEAPEWAEFVKTGTHKERPPVRADWWFVRTAAVLKSVENLGPVGVSKLRTKFGGRKNRGVKPEHFCKASGNILRKSLQQLEKAGLVKQEEKSIHKGRIITAKGVSLLAKAATSLESKK